MSRNATANGSRANGSSDNARLSMIAEDENAVPPTPSNPKLIRTSNRSHHRRWSDQPPRHSFEPSPPEYDISDKHSPERRRTWFGLRSNPQIVKRGGWKRLLVLLLVLLAVIIALAVGLGVGLTHRNNRYFRLSGWTLPSTLPLTC